MVENFNFYINEFLYRGCSRDQRIQYDCSRIQLRIAYCMIHISLFHRKNLNLNEISKLRKCRKAFLLTIVWTEDRVVVNESWNVEEAVFVTKTELSLEDRRLKIDRLDSMRQEVKDDSGNIHFSTDNLSFHGRKSFYNIYLESVYVEYVSSSIASVRMCILNIWHLM